MATASIDESLRTALSEFQKTCRRIDADSLIHFRPVWLKWHHTTGGLRFPFCELLPALSEAHVRVLERALETSVLNSNSKKPYNAIIATGILPLDLYGAFGNDGLKSRDFLIPIKELVRAGCAWEELYYLLNEARERRKANHSGKGVSVSAEWTPWDSKTAQQTFNKTMNGNPAQAPSKVSSTPSPLRKPLADDATYDINERMLNVKSEKSASTIDDGKVTSVSKESASYSNGRKLTPIPEEAVTPQNDVSQTPEPRAGEAGNLHFGAASHVTEPSLETPPSTYEHSVSDDQSDLPPDSLQREVGRQAPPHRESFGSPIQGNWDGYDSDRSDSPSSTGGAEPLPFVTQRTQKHSREAPYSITGCFPIAATHHNGEAEESRLVEPGEASQDVGVNEKKRRLSDSKQVRQDAGMEEKKRRLSDPEQARQDAAVEEKKRHALNSDRTTARQSLQGEKWLTCTAVDAAIRLLCPAIESVKIWEAGSIFTSDFSLNHNHSAIVDKRVVVPLLHNGNHYTLGLLDCERHIVYAYDSLPGDACHAPSLRALQSYYSSCREVQVGWIQSPRFVSRCINAVARVLLT